MTSTLPDPMVNAQSLSYLTHLSVTFELQKGSLSSILDTKLSDCLASLTWHILVGTLASPFLLCHIPGVPHSLFLVLFWFALSLRGLSSPHAFKCYLYVGRYYLSVHISSSHLPPKSLHVHPTAWHTSPLRCLLHLSEATCPNLDF